MAGRTGWLGCVRGWWWCEEAVACLVPPNYMYKAQYIFYCTLCCVIVVVSYLHLRSSSTTERWGVVGEYSPPSTAATAASNARRHSYPVNMLHFFSLATTTTFSEMSLDTTPTTNSDAVLCPSISELCLLFPLLAAAVVDDR